MNDESLGLGFDAPPVRFDAEPVAPAEAAHLEVARLEVAPAEEEPDADLGQVAARAGIGRIEIVAWRDLSHPEAGGSELHAARIAERWAAAGIDVTVTACRPPGGLGAESLDGYRVLRPAGRYGVFPAAGLRGLARRSGPAAADATVEVWNGMPFFSPLWSRRPRLVFLHHVHDGMWDLVMSRRLAALGRFLESRVAPPLYRRTPVVTLSESSRRTIIDVLGLRAGMVSVIPPGVDGAFRPGLERHPDPLVVAVGRLVAYKRFDRLIDTLVAVRRRHPRLQAVIAGEGSARPELEARVAAHGAGSWLHLPGRLGADELVRLYQRAWVLASTSAFEGWGLTITEAAACATPAVASPIAGHLDAVEEGVTGFLADPGPGMEERLHALLTDRVLRKRMQKAALRRAALLSWDRTARDSMRILAAQAGGR